MSLEERISFECKVDLQGDKPLRDCKMLTMHLCLRKPGGLFMSHYNLVC